MRRAAQRVAQSVAEGVLRHEAAQPVSVAQRFGPRLTSEQLGAAFDGSDPFRLVEPLVTKLEANMRHLAGSDIGLLQKVGQHLFQIRGKFLRPTVVVLVSKALHPEQCCSDAQERLAEVAEMIHTASLLHDDVIDKAELRRGKPTVNAVFGNKLAILGGDFLLARSSMVLASLENTKVVRLLSTVIEHLVKGELLQNKTVSSMSLHDFYITKTFYKTASLLAHSCQAAALLNEHSEEEQSIVYDYGKHLGLVFQIVDDILDFEADTSILGKPAMSDAQNGVLSAPLLQAAITDPKVEGILERKCNHDGDLDLLRSIVQSSNSIDLARSMAEHHACIAVAAVSALPPSPSRAGLVSLVEKALYRSF